MIAAYSPARSLFRPSMSACLSKAMLCPPLCAAALLPNEPTDHRVACATPRGWYVLRSRDLVRFHWVQPNGCTFAGVKVGGDKGSGSCRSLSIHTRGLSPPIGLTASTHESDRLGIVTRTW